MNLFGVITALYNETISLMLEIIRLFPKMIELPVWNPIYFRYVKQQLKKEMTLKEYYMSNKRKFEYEFQKQMEEIIELIFYEYDGGEWKNEFGTMSSYFYEEDKNDNYLENGYCVQFFTEKYSDIIFFKIIPKYPTAPVHEFLSNIKKTGSYDGFVCSKHKHNIYNILPNYKPIVNTFCISNQSIDKHNHENIIYLVKSNTSSKS